MLKKKFKFFIQNLGKLFTFSFGFLGLFGLIVLLGGWSIDNNGNLQSDNLINQLDFYDNVTSNVDVSQPSISNNGISITITQNTSQDSYIYFYDVFDCESNGYYTFSIDIPTEYIQNLLITQNNSTEWIHKSDNLNYVNGLLSENIIYGLGIEFQPNTPTITFEVNFMCVSGQTPKPYEPYGTWYSQANYEMLENDINDLNEDIGELEEQLSDLQEQIENINNSNLLYWIINNSNAYMFNINPHGSNPYDIDYFYNNRNLALFNKIISFDSSNNYYYLENFSDEIHVNNPFETDNPSGQYQVLFVLANPCSSNLLFNLFDITYDFGITALYNNGRIATFEPESVSNYYVSVPYDIEDNNPIIAFKVNFYWEDYIHVHLMIDTNSQLINDYYNRGYWYAYDKYNSLYISALNDLNNANSQIQTLTNRVNQLNEQLDNTIGWKSFIFTMADTPFRVVSNVLGFEVFGVNLYKVLIGLITTLAILWLIRKLRK